MKKTIAIIDDDHDILEALTELLELEGHHVSTSFDWNDPIELIKLSNPHIVLLDLLLSGKNGASICREIRKTQGMYTLPIIIMSAHPYASTVIEGSLFTDFLRKPFDTEKLLQLLRKYTL